MRELVDIILFTRNPPPPTHLPILIENSLRCSKKRESLQHRISHRPTYLLRIYIMRIGKEKAALQSRKTHRQTELNRIPWWAPRWPNISVWAITIKRVRVSSSGNTSSSTTIYITKRKWTTTISVISLSHFDSRSHSHVHTLPRWPTNSF